MAVPKTRNEKDADPADRIAALEARVAALETLCAPGAAARAASPESESGAVSYRGEVSFDRDVTWRIDYSAESAAALPPAVAATVLAALGHPARVELVQVLARGPRTANELVDLVESGSKGQLYHHLTTLSAAGVVTRSARGRYTVGAQQLVPVLIALVAAGDIGGALGSN